MGLNVQTDTGIAKASALIAGGNSGIVGDADLMKTAKAILSASAGTTGATQAKTFINRANTNVDITLYDAGYNLDSVKQAATNRTGYDVNLSLTALDSINSLKAQAARVQSQNLTTIVDGKIHVNAEKAETAALKAAFFEGYTDVEVFNSSSADKDRKGPGGFYMPLQNGEEEKEEGLNIVI